jgi:hypothetical protein
MNSNESYYLQGEAYRFWCFDQKYNPSLRIEPEEPLTYMWILAARMLGHPWTGPAIAPPVVEEFEERHRLYLQMTAGKKRGPSTPTNPRGAKATDVKATPARPMARGNEPSKEGTAYQRQPPNPSPTRLAQGEKKCQWLDLFT